MKVMILTNRDIASLGHFSLPQVRRWAVLILGKDPEAEKGKGVKRTYEIDEAFKIYLAGILITVFKMGLAETQNYINNFWPALKKEELLPTQLLKKIEITRTYNEDGSPDILSPHINKIPHCILVLFGKDFGRLEILIKIKNIEEDVYEKTYKQININPGGVVDLSAFQEGLPEWSVFLYVHLSIFLKAVIRAHDYREFLRKQSG